MEYPSVIFWLLFALAAWSRGPGVYYLFFGSWAFGTLAVIPPSMVGGISLTPAWVAAGLLSFKILLGVGPVRFASALLDLRRFGFLTLCTAYALLSAVILPRVFEGQVDVIVMRLTTVSAPQALAPSPSNFTQAFYFLLTWATTVSLYFGARDPATRAKLFAAFRFGAAVTVITGLIDLAAANLGLTSLLTPYRNAAYALLTDTEVMGVKRIVGLQSEASAYASICMAFLAPTLLIDSQPRAIGGGALVKWALTISLFAATYMSTSSGGLVGLAALLLVAAAATSTDALKLRPTALFGLLLTLTMACIGLAVWVWRPETFHPIMEVIEGLVLRKSSTDSYIERSMWNRTAFEAFLGTYALGAGMGAVRASSWPFAVLGNIGLPGALLLATFLIQIALASDRSGSKTLARLATAAKLALIPNLLLASLSGTSVGYGLGAAWLISLVAAVAWPQRTAVQSGAAGDTGTPWVIVSPGPPVASRR